MKPSDFKHLLPNQEFEFAEEISGDDLFSLKVKLNKDQDDIPDPASFVTHEWVDTTPDRYRLKVKNTADTPVFVALEGTE